MNKILVIGCGSIGQRHIRALLSNGEKNIAAYRTKKGQIKNLPKDINNFVKQFCKEDEAFNWKPTHVIISNPTSLHFIFLKKSIIRKLNILVEKPLANNFLDIMNSEIPISELIKINGIVGYNLRFHTLIKKVRNIITSYQYGNAIKANLSVGHYLPFWHPYEDYRKSYAAIKSLGGGTLRNLSHEIDLVQYFFGNVEKLFAKVKKLSNLEIDVDDTVNIIMESEYCKCISVQMNCLYPLPIRKGEIFFERGLLEYNYFTGKIFFTDYDKKQKNQIFSTRESYERQYIIQMKHFLEGNSKIACTIKEGINVIKIIDNCERSSKEGKEVCLN